MAKIRVNASALVSALGIVSIVKPKPSSSSPDAVAGYLFVVKDGKCTIYSSDAERRAMVGLPLEGEAEDGRFALIEASSGTFQYLDGWVQLESIEEEERFAVRLTSESGVDQELSSFNHRQLSPFDTDLKEAKEAVFEMPTAPLREALTLSEPFRVDAGAQDRPNCLKTAQIVKEKGYLFSSDSMRTFHFRCAPFEAGELSFFGTHIPSLVRFLAKAGDKVTFRIGRSIVFVEDGSGHVLGLAKYDKETHTKHQHYSLTRDGHVLRIPKDLVLKTLRQMRTVMGDKEDRLRVCYSHMEKNLRFKASGNYVRGESSPVGCVPITEEDGDGTVKAGGEGSDKSFEFNASITQMIALFDSLKTPEAQLRVATQAVRGVTRYMARTIEYFWISPEGKIVIGGEGVEGAVECRVTRFAVSRD